MTSHPSFLWFDDKWNTSYYKIDDTEACAVVNDDCYYSSVHVESSVMDANSNFYTIRAVLINKEIYGIIYIPDTILSIYGAENMRYSDYPPFELEGRDSNFEFKGSNLFSKDGEDFIYGFIQDGRGLSLDGVKTIHRLGVRGTNVVSLTIPASVERICKLSGNFGSITFEGTLPEFSEGALEEARIDRLVVYTPKDESPTPSVRALMHVPTTDGYRRSDEILFASHAVTLATPKSKGYIALTMADFDHDGDTLFVNSSWIATFHPKTFRRSDVDVHGAKLLIGLHGENDNIRGVCYDVYESPEEIDEQIAYIQKK